MKRECVKRQSFYWQQQKLFGIDFRMGFVLLRSSQTKKKHYKMIISRVLIPFYP